MGKKKLLDATFFVTKRLGRAVHEHGLLPDGCRALVLVTGSPDGIGLLRALVAREQRVPTTAHFVPVYVPDGVWGEPGEVEPVLREVCARFGLPLVVTAPGAATDHFAPIPHAALLAAAAADHEASVVVLDATLQDRALAVLVHLARDARVAGLPLREPLPGAPAVTVVRPLCHVVPESLEALVRAENLPLLARRVAPPDAPVRAEFGRYLAEKKGALKEMLRNISNAPDNVVDEYMA